jgi:hypothetical protein
MYFAQLFLYNHFAQDELIKHTPADVSDAELERESEQLRDAIQQV